ncbi:MAG: hypothetical protein ACR2QV_10870 [Gammaproteobacteria bacterium]
MDRNFVNENQLVDRYLRDELSDDERADFEAFFLSDKETLAELELAEKLQIGLRECADRGLVEAAPTPGGFRRALTSPQWAAAASVLLVCSLAFSGFLLTQLPNDPVAGATRLIPLYATRGADVPRVPSARADEWVVLLVDPGFDPYDEYRAAVADTGTGEVIWEVVDLQPGYEDLLAVGVPGGLLQGGSYEVRVLARSGSAEFAEISRLAFAIPE